MSRIDDLIKQHCPDGVEYRELGTVASYIRGITYSKKDESPEGTIKVIRANNITLNSNTINFDRMKTVSKNVRIRENQWLRANDILISAASGSKAHVGKVAYIKEDIDYCFGGFMAVIRTTKKINSCFLFHLLVGDNFSEYLNMTLATSTINNLSAKIINVFKIPIPPLPVQEAIVDILDRFTKLEVELEVELEAELKARKKQYEHYRDKLLNFDGVEYRELRKIGILYSGLTGKSKSDFSNGNGVYIPYKNIFSNIAVDTTKLEFVKIGYNERQNKVKTGDVLFTGSSENAEECGMSSVLTHDINKPIYLNSFCFGFRVTNRQIFLSEFLKYLFRDSSIRRKITRTANGVTRFNISKNSFSKITIPIPPLPVQEAMVDILDRFTKLEEELEAKLEAELKARRQQYEHYRNRLLDFKNLTTDEHK